MSGNQYIRKSPGLAGIVLLSVLLSVTFLHDGLSQPLENNSFFYPIEEDIPFSSELFESNELIEVELRFDITRFMEEKPQDEYLDAVLTYHFSKNDSVNKKVRLRCRGNYRYRTCPFPPIRFNFTKSDINDELIRTIDNMKLVTHCKQEEKYTNYLLKEYLVYRIYNIITDYSFRVRPMKIRYLDTGGKVIEFTNFAFLIEPIEMLLERINSTEIEDVEISYEELEDGFADRVAMFEFMIANSDWYLPLIHNIRLIRRNDQPGAKLIPVPFDFDYSGFVNTDYAIPREELSLETIRDRAYFGPCRDNEGYRPVLDEYLSHRKEISELIMKFKYLEYGERRDVKVYVDRFFSLYRKDAIIDIININCEKTK
ncbi:MAG TPA: hypothetical protein VMW76_09240 [Bacteroidales bacterium]|nr:hypothetical protein [Bacteroidales bacterium]